jgi:hypothetical protein
MKSLLFLLFILLPHGLRQGCSAGEFTGEQQLKHQQQPEGQQRAAAEPLDPLAAACMRARPKHHAKICPTFPWGKRPLIKCGIGEKGTKFEK